MKALFFLAAITAAVAVTAPTALAREGYFYLGDTLSADVHAQHVQGYRYLGDTLSAVVQPKQAEGITLITDTLGGSGQPPRAEAYLHVTDTAGAPVNPVPSSPGITLITDTRGGKGQPPSSQPYIYGGAPPAVAQAGSGFYRAHLSPTPATSSGDGFDWGDAGLGAVTGFGALFLLAGTSMLVRRRNQQI